MTIEATLKPLKSNQNSIGVLKKIRASCLPGILDLGNYYVQADEALTHLLNFDYCLAPKLLHAPLFGASEIVFSIYQYAWHCRR